MTHLDQLLEVAHQLEDEIEQLGYSAPREIHTDTDSTIRYACRLFVKKQYLVKQLIGR